MTGAAAMTGGVGPGRPRRWGRVLWSALGLAGLLGLGIPLGTSLGAESGPAEPTEVPGAPPAPALSGETLEGERFDLADWRGQVVLVNVWASWCGPCRDELPLLAQASRRWSGDGLRVVGLNVRDGEPAARDLLDQVGAGAEVTTVPDREGTLAVAWGVRGVPETFLVDRAGRIRFHAVGPIDADWLRQRLPRLLAS